MSLVILVDGHALAYRSFYAFSPRSLTSPSGKPVQMIYGFIRQIFALRNNYHPSGIAIFFDPPAKTFRHEIYAEYKAQREKMPEDLAYQLSMLPMIIEEIGLKSIIRDNFESDDLLASASLKLKKAGYKVYILTSDKDLFQILQTDILMLRPRSGGDTELLSHENIESHLGVRADQVKDYLSLTGDSSDNLPGAKGIGPKSAVRLLKEYDNLDNIYENISKISKTHADKLLKSRNDVELTRKLVELRTDLEINMDEMLLVPKPSEKARLTFLELGFKSLMNELNQETIQKETIQEEFFPSLQEIEIDFEKKSYKAINSIDELKLLANKIAKSEILSVDTETTSLNTQEAELVGISFALEEGHGYYLPLRHEGNSNLNIPEAIEICRCLLEDEKIKKLGHNIKYDYLIFKNEKINLKGIESDTMIAAWLLDPQKRRYSLDFLANQFLDYKMISYNELLMHCNTNEFSKVPVQKACYYSSEDADITLRLWNRLKKDIDSAEDLSDLFHRIEVPLISILAEMEYEGIAIDKNAISNLSNEINRRIDETTEEIYKLAGTEFNIRSTKQLSEVLFGKLNLNKIRKTKTGTSTDSDVLLQLYNSHPVIPKMLEHRELTKLLSAYLNPLPNLCSSKTGRLHPNYSQVGTVTGRLSSSSPNIQNIPIKGVYGDRIRNCFIPSGEDKVFVSADYSQIELRILAHFIGKGALFDAYKQDKDIHSLTASQLMNKSMDEVTKDERRIAKTVNFGLIYGQTAHGLSQTLNISRNEADKFIKSYFDHFPEVINTLNSLVEEARIRGYSKTILGRRRQIDEIYSRNNTIRKQGERVAMNSPIQGSAADLIKKAMIDVYRKLRNEFPDAKLIVQVHDELLFQIPKEQVDTLITMIKTEMETTMSFSVPLKVSISCGKTWGEAHV
ncbi:MAG: DNA polymerase I [Candidatus Coatesbacteria bacterium]|nr:DNA polymerase I [Candidatus Coatesbacteria bacterium]